MHKNPVGNRFIVASAKCAIREVSELVDIVLKKIMNTRRSYCNTIYNATKVNTMWVIDNNMKVLEGLQQLSNNNRAEKMETYDFDRLYTNIEHQDLKEKILLLIDKCFESSSSNMFVNTFTKRAWWSNITSNKNKNVRVLGND